MLQALLAERFGLKLHRETKEFPVYALVVDKNGPKLTSKPADYDPKLGSNMRPMTVENYGGVIGSSLDRPVVDLTGIKGEYMFSLDVITELLKNQTTAIAERQAANGGRGTAEASDPMDSGTFAAVQIYGLKIEPRKLPLSRLIIDHLEKNPIGN
jgi:uncharacterized protein (TIGR03435 family)